MKKEKKIKAPFHIADKNPYIGVFLEIILAFFWISIVGPIIASIVVKIPGLPAFLTKENLGTIFGIIVAILLLVYTKKKRMGNDFSGFFNKSNNTFGLKLMTVWVVYWIVGIISVMIFSKLGMINGSMFLAALGAGVMEETMFRIVPLYFAMRHREKKNMIIYTAIATSVVFGLSHILNTFFGAPLDISIIQTIAATMMGLFFIACFIRTGNILFGIVPHFINDVIAGFDAGAFEGSLTYNVGLQPYNYIDLALVIAIAVLAFYLIRPAKHDEILKLWDGILSKKD